MNITYFPMDSEELEAIMLSVNIEEYNEQSDDEDESIEYSVLYCEADRVDGSSVQLDEDDLFSLLSMTDSKGLYTLILEEYRYQ